MWWLATAWALGPGDIAFTGFNADGDDDLAIVVLNTLHDVQLYLSDEETDGLGGMTTGEGTLLWSTGPDPVPPGTVVVFSGLSTTPAASVGTLTVDDSGFNLAAAGDGVLLYEGTSRTTPTTFIAGIANIAGGAGPLTGTGLTEGFSFVTFTVGAHDDGGAYVGPRVGPATFDDYPVIVHNPANWETETSDGLLLLPFDATPFVAGVPVPALPGLGLVALALGLGASGARRLRDEEG